MPYLIPPENFPNNFTAIFFEIIFVVILAIELRIFSKQRLTAGKRNDKGSLLFLLLAVIIGLVSVFIFTYYKLGQMPVLVSYIGFLIIGTGFFIRQWSIITLDKFFTPVVSIQEDQKLITKGPYRYARHPSYLGLILELIGIALAVSNYIAFLIIIVSIYPAISYRMGNEERVLVKKFGSQYLEYKKEVKALIPFIY